MQSNHQQECLSPFWWRITENCKTKNLCCYCIINCDSISFSKERLILERVDNIDLEHLQLCSFNLYHLPGKSVATHTMDTWLISLLVRQCYFGLITVSAKYEGLFFQSVKTSDKPLGHIWILRTQAMSSWLEIIQDTGSDN